MKRCGRRDKVVPIVEAVVEENLSADTFHKSGADFPLDQIHFVCDFGEDLKPVFHDGFGGSAEP